MKIESGTLINVERDLRNRQNPDEGIKREAVVDENMSVPAGQIQQPNPAPPDSLKSENVGIVLGLQDIHYVR